MSDEMTAEPNPEPIPSEVPIEEWSQMAEQGLDEWSRKRHALVKRWTRHEPISPFEMAGAVNRDAYDTVIDGKEAAMADYDRRGLLNVVAVLLDELDARPER